MIDGSLMFGDPKKPNPRNPKTNIKKKLNEPNEDLNEPQRNPK